MGIYDSINTVNPFLSSMAMSDSSFLFNNLKMTNPTFENSTFGGMNFPQTFNSPLDSTFGGSFGVFDIVKSGYMNATMPMFMNMGSPYPKMESGCGMYVVDNKKMESKYSPVIEKYSEQYGLDASVVKALVKQESAFNPYAKSKAGAMGLMQLMPGTAKDLGVSDPMDPEQNIKGGTKYLAQLLKRYHGDYRKAVAAYNGGMGNIDRKGIDFCKETAQYHRKILGPVQSTFNPVMG